VSEPQELPSACHAQISRVFRPSGGSLNMIPGRLLPHDGRTVEAGVGAGIDVELLPLAPRASAMARVE